MSEIQQALQCKYRKVVLLGKRGVGKTTVAQGLYRKYLRRMQGLYGPGIKYDEDNSPGETSECNEGVQPYIPTILEISNLFIRFGTEQFYVELREDGRSGDACYPGPGELLGAHGYILVYSQADKQSFDDLEKIWDDILERSGCDSAPLMIVSNAKPGLGVIGSDSGKKLASKLKAGFVEVNVEMVGVKAVMEGMLERIESANAPLRQIAPRLADYVWSVFEYCGFLS